MKKNFLLMLCLFSSFVAAQEILPKGCKPIVIQGSVMTIPQGKPRLITLHNLTETDLWVTHPLTEGDISSSLSSRLQGNRWSLLKMNTSSFTLSCIESRPGHEQQISCQHVISACEWPTFKTYRKKDIFWVAENMALSPLIAYATRKGWMTPLDKTD
jgi:hypothetical protein